MIPVRLQLSRTKGFDLQALSRATNGLPAVNVARPGKWGNQWRARLASAGGWVCEDMRCHFIKPARDEAEALALALFHHRAWAEPMANLVRAHLRGRNLACFCALEDPCHADTLLELANG